MAITIPPPTLNNGSVSADSAKTLHAPSSAEITVNNVFARLSLHHPNLRTPSLSDRSKFLEKVHELPDLPEWMWYGLLHYAVALKNDRHDRVVEAIDFGVLDELLDTEDLAEPKRVWSVLFYYMFLHNEIEGSRTGTSVASTASESEMTEDDVADEDKGFPWNILLNCLAIVWMVFTVVAIVLLLALPTEILDEFRCVVAFASLFGFALYAYSCA